MKKSKIKLPSEEIFEIFDFMKKENINMNFNEIMFSSILEFLDQRFKNQQKIIQNSYVSSDKGRTKTTEN